jgi:hypothetical protein
VAHRRLQDAWRVRRRWDARHVATDLSDTVSLAQAREKTARQSPDQVTTLDRLLQVCRVEDERAAIRALTTEVPDAELAILFGMTGQPSLRVKSAARRLIKRLRSRVRYQSRAAN